MYRMDGAESSEIGKGGRFHLYILTSFNHGLRLPAPLPQLFHLSEGHMVKCGPVTVIRAREGDRVLISVPMRGFPEGWELEPGDKVVVVDEDEGLVARPISRYEDVDAAPRAAGMARIAEREMNLSERTVFAEQDAGGDRDVVFVIPNEGDHPERVISVRRVRSRR